MIVAIAILEALACVAFLWFTLRKGDGQSSKVLDALRQHFEKKKDLLQNLEQQLAEMTHFYELHVRVVDIKKVRDALKVERGRVTITQAELDTVESRLRELEEIERELQASGIETEEELKILRKKESDLRSKNASLREQIDESLAQMDALQSEMELSAQVQIEVDRMKTELVSAQTRIDLLLTQIEQGNEQYVVLKQRYDALDIEYAQLYEKFSEGGP